MLAKCAPTAVGPFISQRQSSWAVHGFARLRRIFFFLGVSFWAHAKKTRRKIDRVSFQKIWKFDHEALGVTSPHQYLQLNRYNDDATDRNMKRPRQPRNAQRWRTLDLRESCENHAAIDDFNPSVNRLANQRVVCARQCDIGVFCEKWCWTYASFKYSVWISYDKLLHRWELQNLVIREGHKARSMQNNWWWWIYDYNNYNCWSGQDNCKQ